MLKKFIVLICLISTFSCSLSNNVSISSVDSQSIYIVDVGKGKAGGKFSTEIKFVEKFKTKANYSGNVDQTSANISKVDAYLIELPSAPASASDPISGTFASVKNIAKTSSGTFSITFINVPDNTSGNRYYVGVVAKDFMGRIISKNPTPDWTGTSKDMGLAITSGGGDTLNPGSISINSSLQVSSTNPLTVNISLLDVAGAGIETNATVTNGSTVLPAIDAVGI